MADEQQQQEQSQEEQPGPVPYERFKKVNDEFKTLKSEWDKAQKAAQAAKEKELTEQQKWQKLAEERESDLIRERNEKLRMKVALAKGLPPELIDRLRGDDEEALTQDADSLLSLFKPAAEAAIPKTPGVPPSRGSKPAKLDMSTMTPAQIREHKDKLYAQSQS
jgi:hypothetical protein